MDDLVKGIKLLRLSYNVRNGVDHYLTACEDEKGITLTKGETSAENTKWRMQWLPNGKCYFWSCYKKVLAIGAETSTNDLIAFQSKWPIEKGTSAEWNPKFSVDFLDVIEVKLTIRHANQSYFLEGSFYGHCNICRNVWYERLLNIKWDVEIIETTKDEKAGNNNELARHHSGREDAVGRHHSGREDAISNKDYSAYLSNWKVEQVVFYAGGGAIYNSGHNSNGSGTQTNGDVKVRNQIGNYTRFYVHST